MAVESGVGPLLNEQRQQLAQELSNAAQSLNRAAIAAERLARTFTDVDFASPPYEQQTQYMAALSATKDLHITFSLSEGSSQKRKRKEKVAKDPDAPKKPISSYLIFQEAKRKELMEQHPGSPYKEILKRLGVIWKNMSDAEKEPYARAHAKAIAQHGAEMAAYEKNKGISPMAEKSNAKEGKKPAKAKDQKPAPKPKSGAAVAPASRAKAPAAPPVAGESESGSESSEDESSEEEESTEDESEPEAPPPTKKPRVAAKPPTPVKIVKKETKPKEKK